MGTQDPARLLGVQRAPARCVALAAQPPGSPRAALVL